MSHYPWAGRRRPPCPFLCPIRDTVRIVLESVPDYRAPRAACTHAPDVAIQGAIQTVYGIAPPRRPQMRYVAIHRPGGRINALSEQADCRAAADAANHLSFSEDFVWRGARQGLKLPVRAFGRSCRVGLLPQRLVLSTIYTNRKSMAVIASRVTRDRSSASGHGRFGLYIKRGRTPQNLRFS